MDSNAYIKISNNLKKIAQNIKTGDIKITTKNRSRKTIEQIKLESIRFNKFFITSFIQGGNTEHTIMFVNAPQDKINDLNNALNNINSVIANKITYYS